MKIETLNKNNKKTVGLSPKPDDVNATENYFQDPYTDLIVRESYENTHIFSSSEEITDVSKIQAFLEEPSDKDLLGGDLFVVNNFLSKVDQTFIN